ncbi:MAG: D-alanyl-D-alanine carboxypeptidase [Butyrivibrio sp.]|nr:D-alanyl-D-alanine carboxypeptidase [Butyrivibrio sp.]
MSFRTKNNIKSTALIAVMLFILCGSIFGSFISYAETDYEQQAAQRKTLPIQSNEIYGWPEGPEITAQAAIVMEANTGTILYSKNIHEELYPASTTKMLTCLLAAENSNLSDMVTFSSEAIFSVPKGGSNIGMDVGQSITLEQALYGILVGSANEVANAVAEHVSGSIPDFVDLMNNKAKELGCTNTHFANTNGLQADDHYTSAYDLALIAKAFFSNETMLKVGNTPRYHFIATDTQPDDFYINNKHKLITGEITCDGVIGGKTGFTNLARETLVTGAERNGMRLICVVFMEESPAQFTDTVTLLDYGFSNFSLVNVSDSDTRYMPNDSLFFESDHDVFGRSGTILKLEKGNYIVLPKTSEIEDSDYEISYDITDEEKVLHPNAVARVSYSFGGEPIGKTYVCYTSEGTAQPPKSIAKKRTIYINIKLIILFAIGLVLLLTVGGLLISWIIELKRTAPTRNDRIRYNRRKKDFKKTRFKSRNPW